MSQNSVKSIYIHIPFCNNICSYCDFCKMYYDKKLINKYLDSLNKEIKQNYKQESIKTLYIGGGTPSCLNVFELNKLFQILKQIKLAKKYEFTFECNVSDLNKEKLNILKENGVNRISIGVQSFNKKLLKNIGRNELPNLEKIELAKKYFDNVNIDLIYGINNETIEYLSKDLETFLSLNVNHISTYSLILENHTKLKIENYQELDDDTNRKMYDLIQKTLSKKGYKQYELSNFSKPKYESKHNLVYWNNEHYYGFGLGASGYINNYRYTNTKSINKYLSEEYIYEKEIIDKRIDMENEMILGLRKIKGVSKKKFYKKYNQKVEDVFNVKNLKQNKNYFYIAKKNLFISNYILSDFININN